MNKHSLPLRGKGFTLVELLIVMTLISSLAALVLVNFRSAQMRGRDAVRKSDLRNIQTALRLYYNDIGGYPLGSGTITGCGGATPGACTWGTAWIRNNTTYMNILPADPLSTQTYIYTGVAGNEDYTLRACLESKSDSKGVQDLTACPNGLKYEVRP